MDKFYNENIFLLYLGGIFSLVLTVVIVFLKQIFKRKIERRRLEEYKKFKPEEIGDVDAKLNDSIEYRFPNFLEELVIWGIQPILVISFVNLFTGTGVINSTLAFALIILTLFHEFHFAEVYSNKKLYQFIVLSIWPISFFLICCVTNIHEANKAIKPTVNIENSTTKKDSI